MRAKVSGWSSRLGPRGGGERLRVLSVGDAGRGTPEHVADLVFGEAGELGRAQGEEQRAGLLAVGIVGGEDDLAGRDPGVHVQQVDRAPDGRVEVDALPPGEGLRERGQIGDARVRDDQRPLRIRVVELPEVLGDRRQATPAVDEDRHPALGGEGEDRLQALVVQQEALGAGVELDPTGAPVETARRLLDRLGGEVEADEGDDEPRGALCGLQRAVVGRPEGRLAVGLVHAERKRPLRTGTAEKLDELLARRDHPVDVAADVDVRVEDGGSRRQARAKLRLVALHQTACPLQNLVHAMNLPAAATIGSRA